MRIVLIASVVTPMEDMVASVITRYSIDALSFERIFMRLHLLSQCNMPCSGNPKVVCGGNFTNSVYNNTCGKNIVQRPIAQEYQSSAEPRLIVPTVRTSISKKEVLSIKVRIILVLTPASH